MLSHRLRLAAILICSVASLCVGRTEVKAFAVSPVIIELEVAPGAAAHGEVQIVNTENSERTYYISTQNFVAKGEEGQQDFLPEDQATGLASWIVPEQRSVTLGAGQATAFTYVVNIPTKVEPGGHYAALFFSDKPGEDEGSAVGVGAKVGILFLLRVPGEITESLRVESFRATSDRLSSLPAFFELRLRNLGNVHTRPEGTVVLRNMFGSVVGKVPVNPRQAVVLPNSIRRFDPAWANTFEIDKGGFLAAAKNEWKNFAIGRYTAEVEAVYGSQKQELSAQAVFWVFPWRVLLLIAFGIVLLIVLLKLYNRLIVRAALKKGQGA
jgi:hypothetical protein